MKLTLTDKQAQVVSEALELFSRLGMGQYDRLRDRIHNSLWGEADEQLFKTAEDALRRLSLPDFMSRHPGSSWGIRSPEISDAYRIAYDMHQVVRNKLFMSLPEGERRPGHVNGWPPMQSGAEPLPEVE